MTASRPSRVLATRARRVLALTLAAMIVSSAAVALASVRTGKYVGTTSEHWPLTLTVTAKGRAITHFKTVLAYNGKCGQGGGPGLSAAPAQISVGAGGSFSKNVTLSLTGISTPIHDPGRIFGKVSGSKVTGTVEQFLGAKVNKCYIETFTARLK